MVKATVETSIDLAIKEGNYSALRGMLVTHARRSDGITLTLRLLERIPDIQMLQILRDLRSDDDADIHRLASAAVLWTTAFQKQLEDIPDDIG